MSAQSKINSIKAINTQLKDVLKKTSTLQESIHKLALSTAIHAYIYTDANIVSNVLNALNEVNGSIRVNAVSYWFKHVAGLETSQDAKTGVFGCKFAHDNYTSDLAIAFTYDKAHVATLKVEANRFWKIAPKDFKELKIFEDIAKVTAGVESQYARGLVLGTVTEEEITAHLEGMLARIRTAKASKATKEWIAKFQAQSNPEVEVEALDKDLVEELRMEELLEA